MTLSLKEKKIKLNSLHYGLFEQVLLFSSGILNFIIQWFVSMVENSSSMIFLQLKYRRLAKPHRLSSVDELEMNDDLADYGHRCCMYNIVS
jgi:hypothetical protein